MSSFNKVIILGRLTRDPELRVTPNGASVCSFGVATSRKYKAGENGDWKEEATFMDISCFGRQGENVAKYFSKGKPIFIEGRLKFDQWESKTGEKRSKLSIVLENFQFVGGRDEEASQSSGYQAVSPPQRNQSTPAPAAPSNEFEDDIPF